MSAAAAAPVGLTDPVMLGVGVLAVVGVLVAFRGGARAGSRVATRTREVSRMGGVLLRAVVCGAVIVGVQWAVITTTADPVAWRWSSGCPRCSPAPRWPGCSWSPPR